MVRPLVPTLPDLPEMLNSFEKRILNSPSQQASSSQVALVSQKNFNKQGFSHKNDAQNKGFSSQNRGFLPAIKNHKAQNKTHDMVTADSPLLGLGIQDALSDLKLQN